MPLPKFSRYENQLTRKKHTKQAKALVLALVTFGIAAAIIAGNLFLPDFFDEVIAQARPIEDKITGVSFKAAPQVLAEDTVNFGSKAQSKDARAYVLDEYFKYHNSPMYGTGNIIFDRCRFYEAPSDCLIVAAIADAETDLCKYHTSATYYNCWGFGGGGTNRIYFNSWEKSIDAVYRTLAWSELYGNDVMKDPRLMERTFCGWEPGCTGWGNRVIFFMDEIDQFAKDLGINGGMYGFR